MKHKNGNLGRVSLVVQCLRIHLPQRGHGFEPWSWKVPRAVEQLSPRTVTTKPELYSLRVGTPKLATASHGIPVRNVESYELHFSTHPTQSASPSHKIPRGFICKMRLETWSGGCVSGSSGQLSVLKVLTPGHALLVWLLSQSLHV